MSNLLRSIVPVLLLFPYNSFALQGEFRLEHLTEGDGLPNNSVHAIRQDSLGYLWFATEDGLCRYDGYRFTTFRRDDPRRGGLSFSVIFALFEDRSSTLWIGTYAGLNRFDHALERFTGFMPGPGDTTNLSDQTVRAIGEDAHGVLWVGTRNGLDRFDDARSTFTHFKNDSSDESSLSFNSVSVIYRDRSGTLWIGTGDYHTNRGGLNRYIPETQSFKRYVHDPRDRQGLADHWITALYEDRHGNFWVGTDGGLQRFDRTSETFSLYRHDPRDTTTINSDHVKCLGESHEGKLLVGTWGGGLDVFDQETERFARYVNTLSGSNVLSLCQDRSGVLWVGTYGDGAYGITHYTPRIGQVGSSVPHVARLRTDLTGVMVNSIGQNHSGVLWFGTDGRGAWAFDPISGALSSVVNHGDRLQTSIYPIHEDIRGRLLFGTQRGLVTIESALQDPQSSVHEYSERRTLNEEYITAIVEDTSGVFWLGTYGNGLYRYCTSDETLTRYPFDSPENDVPDHSPRDMVYSMVRNSRDELWLGTNKGLARFDRRLGKFTWYVPHPHDPTSLGDLLVSAVCEDRTGVLWIGLDNGLDRFHAESGTFEHYSTSDGLRDPRVQSILDDHRGNLWLGTPTGISRFDPRTGRFRNYGVIDGLGGSTSLGAYRDSLGNLFFGRGDGLTVFHPESLYTDTRIPSVVLTAFSVLNEPVLFDSSITAKKLIELSHRQNMFSIEFAALSYFDHRNIQYAYRLEGYDQDWVYSGSRNQASYMNLEGGIYLFRVKACNYDGVWNETGTSLAIIIAPPFWQTWWFRVLSFVTALALVGGSIRYVEVTRLRRRMRVLEQERALERERTRISQDMHDEVGSTLTEISILSELARKTLPRHDVAGTHVERISEKSREVIDNIGEIIWALNPKNSSLPDLASYLRRYAVEYCSTASIRCHCDFPDTLPELPLSTETRRNLFLVAKEALHNVVKHSGATDAYVSFRVAERDIMLEVRDNGKGFSPDERVQHGNGMTTMKKRAAEIGGRLEVNSEPGKGAVVSVRLLLAEQKP